MEKKFVNYPKIGVNYIHYKGGSYEVITMATHSDTNEPLVIYKSLLFGSVHARPLSQWFEQVEDENGMKVSRFYEDF